MHSYAAKRPSKFPSNPPSLPHRGSKSRSRTSASRILLLAALPTLLLFLAPACARTRTPSEQASPHSSAEPALDICAAVQQKGPLPDRLEKQLPLRVGGLVLVLQGAEASDVERALASLELSGTRVTRCAAGDLVAWVPGVDASAATGLESTVLASAPNAKIKERALVAPQAAEPAPRPRD